MRWSILRLIGIGIFLTSFSLSLAQVPGGQDQQPQGGFGGGGRGFGGGGGAVRRQVAAGRAASAP